MKLVDIQNGKFSTLNNGSVRHGVQSLLGKSTSRARLNNDYSLTKLPNLGMNRSLSRNQNNASRMSQKSFRELAASPSLNTI